MKDKFVTFETRSLTVDNKKIDLLWPASDTSCFNIIAKDWVETNHIIMKYVKERRIVVQAGGNCGMYPLLHSMQFEYVFTFEPDPVNFYCLANNCKASKIFKFNTAVGDKAKALGLGVLTTENVGMHKIGAGSLIVYAITIDSLDLPYLSLLHLDVEGYELPALRGAENSIKRCRPVIALEITPAELSKTRQYLADLNYKEVYKNESNSSNYIFIPSENS